MRRKCGGGLTGLLCFAARKLLCGWWRMGRGKFLSAIKTKSGERATMGFLDRKVWAGLVCVLGLVVSCCVAARGQSGGGGVSGGSGEHEKKGAAALEAVRGNPLDLREFLKGMPKGADLHNHLSGAV